jgi:hypothetical protein
MMMSEYGGALSAALIVALCGLISQALWVLVKSHGRASSRRRLTGVRKWKFAVASLKVQKVALDAYNVSVIYNPPTGSGCHMKETKKWSTKRV